MSYLPLFSHIYLEERAMSYPLTERILKQFPRAIQIPISNYKEVFNRPRQRWDHQKHSLKLILAVRNEAFIYPGSAFVPNFEYSQFFYTTPVLNCIYGCEYCYLQGMFPSANLVAFVNDDDFIQEATDTISQDSPAYLCISYDTDLLALETIFGYCARYIEYARRNPHVTIEIRTKSANIRALEHITPPPNIILAWTISPESVISRYEHRTPPLSARLAAIKRAYTQGWRIRLCIDPMVRVENWRLHYSELVKDTFSTLTPSAISDISVGVFRIPSGYLRAMQTNNKTSPLVQYPYTVCNKSASYTPNEHHEMITMISHELQQHVPQEKICPVPWQL